jgi:hypothetical protein
MNEFKYFLKLIGLIIIFIFFIDSFIPRSHAGADFQQLIQGGISGLVFL